MAKKKSAMGKAVGRPAGKAVGKTEFTVRVKTTGQRQGAIVISQKPGAGRNPNARLFTPQAIVDYYRAHRQLPPELLRKSDK